MFQAKNIAVIMLLGALALQLAPVAHAGPKKARIADEGAGTARPSFGKPSAVFQIGSEEDRLGLIRTAENSVPFGMFYGPSSFVYGPDGLLYVVDCRNYRVSVFDPDNKYSFVKSINYFTDREHKSFMNDIAVDATGSVYLVDTAGRNVIRFSPLGLPEAVIGLKSPAFKGLSQPGEVAVDRRGHVFVRDFGDDAIYEFGPDGKYEGALGPNRALYFNSKNVRYMIEYHADSESWKIFEETERGETHGMIYEIARESASQTVQIVGIDSNDDVYVKIFRAGAISVMKISADGKRVADFAAHNQPDFDTTRFFFVDAKRRAPHAVRYNGKGVEVGELTAR